MSTDSTIETSDFIALEAIVRMDKAANTAPASTEPLRSVVPMDREKGRDALREIVLGIRALRLAATLGHPFLDAPPSPYIWDGRASFRGPAPATSAVPRGPMGPREICHELAHRLCATAEEQALPEWGLGREPTYGADAPRDMPAPSRFWWDDIEAAVCHIQGLLHGLIGEDPIVRLRTGEQAPLQVRGAEAAGAGRGLTHDRIALAVARMRLAGVGL